LSSTLSLDAKHRGNVATQTDEVKAMKQKLYSINNLNISALLSELEQFFKQQGHQVQILPLNGGQVLQALKESDFSALLGQSSALTIKAIPEAQGLRVEIGSSKWIDKAAVGMIGYVIMPVLAIIPMIGMYNQYKLGEDAWRVIDAFVARAHSGAPSASPAGSSKTNAPPGPHCQKCGSWLAPQAAFCSGCGGKVGDMPACQKCGASNYPGARFCSRCGAGM
jgi:hypothetical protein